jgi:hypothetical protein
MECSSFLEELGNKGDKTDVVGKHVPNVLVTKIVYTSLCRLVFEEIGWRKDFWFITRKSLKFSDFSILIARI